MNIEQACLDPNLFGNFQDFTDKSWQAWRVAKRAIYGGPCNSSYAKSLVRQCMGRDAAKLPRGGFQTALFLVGRRGGKSRSAATIAAYEAILAGNEKKLAVGERGMVPIISPSKHQSRVVKEALVAVFESSTLLQDQVVRETAGGFELETGTRIEIVANDFRTVRGYTLLAAVVDEAAFMGMDADSVVKNDTELIRALRPGLATTGGKLIAITSPYARRGWCFEQHQRNFGNDAGKVLVWQAPSLVMNPTLDPAVVEEAMADDPAAARAEYLAEFRDDVAAYVDRATVEAAVIPGRVSCPREKYLKYFAFADISGGRGDDAALCIGHIEGRTVQVDKLVQYKPPFNPHTIIRLMVGELTNYGVSRVTGDNYAAEFVNQAFEQQGIAYERCTKSKSELYLELLPRLNSGELGLVDNELLVNQIANLERRTRAGGRDLIDHPQGQHDDLANVVAGLANLVATPQYVCGVF